MYFYSADKLTAKQNYKFLTGSVIPRPIAWITTMNKQNKLVNAAPFSYFNVVAKDLPLISLSINRKDNEMKDTAKNLLSQHEGVIHLVNDSVLKLMNQTAATLPSEKSELEGLDITLVDSRSIDVPAIKESPIRYEVKLHQHIEIKNHEQTTISDLFILEVLNYYFSKELFDAKKEYIDPIAFDPISRLAGNSYSHINKIMDIKRPD